MIVEEFISNYAQAELNKLEALAKREGVSSFLELDLEFYALGTSGNRNSVGGQINNDGNRSPGNKSPHSSTYRASTAGASSINGTTRAKTLTAGQIKNAQQQ